MTPAKEVPLVTTKVKAEKQNSVKGRSAGNWEGQRQCKEELFLNKKNRYLFSHSALGKENPGAVLRVNFMKQREFFSDNSEIRLPVKKHLPSLLLAPWRPWESWPTCTAALGQNRIALGTENMSSDLGLSSSNIIRAAVPPHLFPILPLFC